MLRPSHHKSSRVLEGIYPKGYGRLTDCSNPTNRQRLLYVNLSKLRIPTMAITYSDLMAITIPSDADRRRSEATLSCSYHAEVIAISQSFCF